MPRRSLTDRSLKALKQDTSDAVVPGLAVRIGAAGVLISRFPGRTNPTRRAIGTYPTVSLEQARAKARSWLEMIQAGIDPAVEVAAAAREADREQQDTFRAVAESFIAKHVASRRTAVGITGRIRGKLISVWGDRPIGTITRRDIIALVENDAASAGAGSARKTLAYTRRLFRWAAARDLVTVNPCAAIAVADFLPAATSRDRVFDDNELALLLRATAPDGGVGYPDAPYVRLLLLTATRRSAICRCSIFRVQPGSDVVATAGGQGQEHERLPDPAATGRDQVACIAAAVYRRQLRLHPDRRPASDRQFRRPQGPPGSAHDRTQWWHRDSAVDVSRYPPIRRLRTGPARRDAACDRGRTQSSFRHRVGYRRDLQQIRHEGREGARIGAVGRPPRSPRARRGRRQRRRIRS